MCSAALAIMPKLLRLIDEARRVGLTIVYIRTTHSEWTDTPSWIYRTLAEGRAQHLPRRHLGGGIL